MVLVCFSPTYSQLLELGSQHGTVLLPGNCLKYFSVRSLISLKSQPKNDFQIKFKMKSLPSAVFAAWVWKSGSAGNSEKVTGFVLLGSPLN